MQLDFLAGEYGGTAKSRPHQHVQEILAHKARGADLVFDQHYTQDVEGTLLNGARMGCTYARIHSVNLRDPYLTRTNLGQIRVTKQPTSLRQR